MESFRDRVNNAFACEHFRTEGSGRASAIGMYLSNIAIPELPAVVQLSFVLVMLRESAPQKFWIQVAYGDKINFEFEFEVPENAAENMAIALGGTTEILEKKTFHLRCRATEHDDWEEILAIPVTVGETTALPPPS